MWKTIFFPVAVLGWVASGPYFFLKHIILLGLELSVNRFIFYYLLTVCVNTYTPTNPNTQKNESQRIPTVRLLQLLWQKTMKQLLVTKICGIFASTFMFFSKIFKSSLCFFLLWTSDWVLLWELLREQIPWTLPNTWKPSEGTCGCQVRNRLGQPQGCGPRKLQHFLMDMLLLWI